MNFEQIDILLKAMALLVALAYALILKPFINSKLTANDQEDLMTYICIGINAADQILKSKTGKDKKEFVTEFVKDKLAKLPYIDVTDDEISVMIEGMLKEIKDNVGAIEKKEN